jgi:hypothetical protein
VFGIGELGRREIGAREIEEKLHISSVWRTKEIRERESLNTWGPHISDSPQNCEEIAERDLFPILSSLQTTRKRKNILNRNKIKVKHRIKNGLLGLRFIVYSTVYTQINNGTIVGVSALEQNVVVNFVG